MSKNRVLFLDRDGVVNIDQGYVGSPDRFTFMPGLFPFLRAARDRGYLLAIATNQSGVARGLFTAADYENVTGFMRAALRREAIEIDLILQSFEHPEGSVAPYARESFWRKPNPGMVMEGLRRLQGDAAGSIFIGDNLRDMQAAQGAGIGIGLWLGDKNQTAPDGVHMIATHQEALAFMAPSA